MKKLFIFLLAIAVMSGCGKANQLGQIPEFKQDNAIKIDDGLGITKTLVDSFTEDYYRAEDLYKMLLEEADSFNSDNGIGSLTAGNVNVEDGIVNVVMKFSGREAYATYNDAVFFVGKVSEALDIGLRLESELVDIRDSSKTLYNEALTALRDNYIIITNEHKELAPFTIETFGKISYVSKGIEPWFGNNSVSIDNINDNLIYIMFK